MTKTYKITKLFIGGLLNGMTIVETQSFPMEVGFVCLKPIGGSPYKIIACQQV